MIVVRHGETEENARHILMGHLPGHLSAKGREQARALALRLKKERIDIIFSSDLLRARETTRAIARYHKAPIFYTKELREQDYGVFQGRSVDELILAQKRRKNTTPPGGESLKQLRARVKLFMQRLSGDKSMADKRILISAHSGVAWSIMSILVHAPMQKFATARLRNGGMLVFEVKGRQAKLVNDDMFQ